VIATTRAQLHRDDNPTPHMSVPAPISFRIKGPRRVAQRPVGKEQEDTEHRSARRRAQAAQGDTLDMLDTLPDALVGVIASFLPHTCLATFASCCTSLRSSPSILQLIPKARRCRSFLIKVGGGNKVLMWSSRGLEEADAEVLAMLVVDGTLFSARMLNVSDNQLGKAGVVALTCGPLYALRQLDVSSNSIGDDGMAALSSGLARGLLPNLLDLCLAGNQITDLSALCQAVDAGALCMARTIDLSENWIGDAAVNMLAEVVTPGQATTSSSIASGSNAVASRPPPLAALKTLQLVNNFVGADGASSLAAALHDGALPLLRSLHVDEACAGIWETGSPPAPLLAACRDRRVHLRQNSQGDDAPVYECECRWCSTDLLFDLRMR